MSPPRTPLSNAWQWSLERSPLLNMTRWILHRGYPNAKARARIHAANLPEELSELLDRTVRKTKLWRSERADIAQELITHTRDALEAGRTPKQIIESFGNPKKAAKLLRRATKRKRPLYWRTLHNIRKVVVSVTLLLFISYAALALRFFTGTPSIKKNYAVYINAQNNDYTEDQRAWPIYKEVRMAWDLHIRDTFARQKQEAAVLNINKDYDQDPFDAGLQSYPQISTDHPHYQETVQTFESFEPQLKRLREATHRPVIGIKLGFEYEPHDDNEWSHFTPMIPPSETPENNPSLIAMLLPHLGTMRGFANTLAFDAIIAARHSDSPRAYESLDSMLALARQRSFDQTLISDLVGNAIARLAIKTIDQIVHEHPGTLTRDHLVALSHGIAQTRPTLELTLDGEIMMFHDVIQRAYTDDGHGNGRITKNGMRMFVNYASDSWDGNELQGKPIQVATGPISLAVVPDRKSQLSLYNNMMDTINRVADTGPQTIALIEHQRSAINQSTTTIPGILYSPVELLMPALGRALSSSFITQMSSDATAAMLAIEIYRIDHAKLPETFDDLTPNYLPSPPQDPFNPNQPLKYKVTDTGYLIYSVGDDGDDDDARFIDERQRDYHLFTERYPASKNAQGDIILDNAGNPILDTPKGPDGDWILIDMNRPPNHAPKTKKPDQSPAPESIP